jgi:hypothetical protein
VKKIGIIECKNSNFGMWKIIHMSTKSNVIPFIRNGTTSTSTTKKQMKIGIAIWDPKRHGDPTL